MRSRAGMGRKGQLQNCTKPKSRPQPSPFELLLLWAVAGGWLRCLCLQGGTSQPCVSWGGTCTSLAGPSRGTASTAWSATTPRTTPGPWWPPWTWLGAVLAWLFVRVGLGLLLLPRGLSCLLWCEQNTELGSFLDRKQYSRSLAKRPVLIKKQKLLVMGYSPHVCLLKVSLCSF